MIIIRSQDQKRLVECKGIGVVEEKEGSARIEGVIDSSEDGWVLGKYKNITRALLIMDEIQNQLTNMSHTECQQVGTCNGWVTTEHRRIVYEMPRE